MKHNFKTGDRVLFINENDQGTILIFIGDAKAKVINSRGFEQVVGLNEIIAYPSLTHKEDAYGDFVKSKDQMVKGIEYSKKKFKQFAKDKIYQLVFKADLHIENLIEHFKHLENFEIIQIQLNRCEDCIAYAKKEGIPRLNLVHGIGKGTLKKEIHSLLKTYNLEFSDEYGFTEILIT
ncbi:MAG: hypothetical protein CBC83_00415 [Flavobacteriales bacterium TMED123]|nr:MAG: hypothetical protein CBC83_00415 [Flavobacteriales bacterium TMED123]|tara:strand:- start:3282 stop:3815 length:534 start_codon:yes stop_codon:yes gene_type:complete